MKSRKRQYKTRITLWGLGKNIKEKEMRVIVRKKMKRKKLDGKESNFLVRDRPVPPNKITRYMKENDISSDTPLSELSPATGKQSILL